MALCCLGIVDNMTWKGVEDRWNLSELREKDCKQEMKNR